MRVSWGTPSAKSISAACTIVCQSDWLPMMMPTSGAASLAMAILPFLPGTGPLESATL
jgi:hypothetical protein